jgi:fatty-acyl-CoA synthase
LVNSPETPVDQAHHLRLAMGNGLRPDVWDTFTKRFNIPRIGEFYASTEGNANMVNQRNKFGAVGFVSPLMKPIYPIKIAKFDVETEDVVRNAQGFCIECGPDEPGELLGKIEEGDVTREFAGYTNQQAGQKKILSNVFEKGDRWFRTGDLLKCDKLGFYYFVDRVGDTFRWKGENVATSEVSEIISLVPGVLEANVYGVAVPLHDGRAGMAALVVDSNFTFERLYAGLQELPSYARPYFVRLSNEIDITGTFKHKKHTLVVQGFNPDLITEPLYIRDDAARTFVPLTREIYEELQRPNSRL